MSGFLVLFFLSGFCSLIYEVVWLRLGMGAFGVTGTTVSMFLSVFMTGLGLGSWGAGALAGRLKRRAGGGMLRLYAGAELLIGVSAFAVPFLLEAGRRLLAERLGEVGWASASYHWLSGLAMAASLLPWTLLMGATFPLAMAAIERGFPERSRDSFSYLYLANVLGAALGTALSAYVMIELLGFRGTLAVAASLNAAIALLALAMSAGPAMSRAGAAARAPRACPAAQGDEGTPAPARPVAGGAAVWLLFAAGLASMGMEVVWVRQFTAYLGNTVYAFAGVLALYLLSFFAGSCVYRAAMGSRFITLDMGWIAVGTVSLLPLCAADPFLPMGDVMRVVLGVAPVCWLLGLLTPGLVDRYSAGDPRRAGVGYAVNVLGCLAGPLIAGFVLLPRLSEGHALAALSLPLFAAGWWASRRQEGPGLAGRRGAKAVFVLLAALSAVLVAGSSGLEDRYRIEQGMSGGRIASRRDSQASSLAMGEGMTKALLVNNIGMTKLTPITKVMAHLPLVFLDHPADNALVICFGMGTTFRSLLSWGVRSTAVELVPGVTELFGFFYEDAGAVLASPLGRVVIDDGRRFLARTAERFDVITVDPAPPMEAAGTSFLYSKEFYALVNRRLRDDGIMQHWIMEPMEPAVISAFALAIKESFPYVRAFGSVEGWGYHCLASRRPILDVRMEELFKRMPAAARSDLVEYGPYADPRMMARAMMAREVSIDRLIGEGARPLTDDRPVNEYMRLRHGLPRVWGFLVRLVPSAATAQSLAPPWGGRVAVGPMPQSLGPPRGGASSGGADAVVTRPSPREGRVAVGPMP